MTALRFQTGGRHQTSPASLRGACNRPCQKCKWQVTPKDNYTLGADCAVQALCRNLSVKPTHMQLVGEHSTIVASVAEPLWTDSSLKSGIGVCELIFTDK